MKKIILAVLCTIAACSSYNKLPKEEKLKDQVSQMLTDSQLSVQDLQLSDYGRTRIGYKDAIVANAHFVYKGQQLTCTVVAYEKETIMGKCSTGAASTNAQFTYDVESVKTTYQKATTKTDNVQQGQGAGKYDIDGSDL